MNTKRAVLLAISVLAVLFWTAASVHAAVPGTMTYQGRLTNAAGTPVSGSVALTFNIYDISSGGSALWTETINGVTVTNGIFTVTLGNTTPITSSIISTADLYIGVTAGADAEMTPRQKLALVPFAVKAAAADSVAWSGITSVPAGLSDGDNDTLGVLFCSNGQVAKSNGSAWICGADSGITAETDPLVNALGKAALSCAPNQVAKWNGSAWVCGADSGITAETDPLVNALGKAALSCSTNQVAKWNGSAWICAADVDTDTTYAAGTGLMLTGTTFSVANPLSLSGTTASSIITGTNASTASASSGIKGLSTAASGSTYGVWGQSDSASGRGVFGLGLSGVWGESSLANGTGVIGVAYGSGITSGVYGENSSFNGRAVYGYASDATGINMGVLGWSASLNGFGVYGYNSGGGYAGFFQGNTHVQGNLSVSGTISGDGSGLTGVTAAAAWGSITGMPAGFSDGTDNDTTYAAGTGLMLTGTTFGVVPAGITSSHIADGTITVADLGQNGCGVNQILKWNGTAWACAVDIDTDTNSGGTVTSVAAGAGLSGGTITGSGTIAVDTNVVQTRVTGSCSVGNYITAINSDGTVTCSADQTGAGACIVGDEVVCYTGAVSTRNVGSCRRGNKVCQSGGTWGSCTGEIVPIAEIQDNGIDDNCNGNVDIGRLFASNGAANDWYGYAIAASSDGKIVAVGASKADVGGNIDQGSVYVNKWDGSLWVETRLTASDGAVSDQFGFSVASSSDGNTVAVGAPYDNIGFADQGSVYVNKWNGSSWVEAKLTASDGAQWDYFGYSISVSSDGNTVAVGVPGDDVGVKQDQGSVYVYKWNGSSWVETKLTASDGLTSDFLGIAIAVSSDGNTVVSGAYYGDGVAAMSGSAYAYKWNGSSWVQTKLTASDGAGSDQFGGSISVSSDGNIITVGADLDDVGANIDQGSAYVYKWNGSAWVETKLVASDGLAGDYFGYSISMSPDGNVVAVGATVDDSTFIDQGSAYAYKWNGSSWIETKLIATDGLAADWFATAIAVSFDGSTIAIGAYGDDIGTNTLQGSAYVFKWDGSTWVR